ncbi:MAG: hypothetical protein ABTA16_13400 [Niallia sp.]
MTNSLYYFKIKKSLKNIKRNTKFKIIAVIHLRKGSLSTIAPIPRSIPIKETIGVAPIISKIKIPNKSAKKWKVEAM